MISAGAYFKLESNPNPHQVLLSAIKSRLIATINTRINNGEFTERGLARLLGVSQPQLHNVLKGARKLQAELADRLMLRFNIGIVDLLDSSELPQARIEDQICDACPIRTTMPARVIPKVSLMRKPAAREFSVLSDQFESVG